MNVRRLMLSFVTVAMLLVACVLAGSFFLARHVRRHGLFFPQRFPSGNWSIASYSPRPREIAFTAADGTRLSGWLFVASSNPSPFLLWFHGNAGNITERGPVAEELARRGVTVMLFDYRGFGRSGGTPTEQSVYLDAEAAWQYATSELGADPDRMILYGESIGGPYAARVASHHRPCAVVIENSFPSLRSVARVVYPILPISLVAKEGLTTLRWLNEAGAPVLVMHGRRDQVLPLSLGLELYDGLEVPKRLFLSETAGHGEIPWAEGSRYYAELLRFLHENCPETSRAASTRPTD